MQRTPDLSLDLIAENLGAMGLDACHQPDDEDSSRTGVVLLLSGKISRVWEMK